MIMKTFTFKGRDFYFEIEWIKYGFVLPGIVISSDGSKNELHFVLGIFILTFVLYKKVPVNKYR